MDCVVGISVLKERLLCFRRCLMRLMPSCCWDQTGCSWAQYKVIIGQFGWNGKLQYYLDLWHDHPQRRWLQRPEVLAML